MQVFQPSSWLSVVEGQPMTIQRAGIGNLLQLRCDQLSVLSLIRTPRHRTSTGRAKQFKPPWVLPQIYIKNDHPIRLKVIYHRQNDIKSCYIYHSFDWTDHVNIILSQSQLPSQTNSHHHESCRQSTGKSFSILVIRREIIDKAYRCSSSIGHKHYTTSRKSQIQQ